MFNSKYKALAIYGIVIFSFFNLNGLNALIFYSNEVFTLGTDEIAQQNAR